VDTAVIAGQHWQYSEYTQKDRIIIAAVRHHLSPAARARSSLSKTMTLTFLVLFAAALGTTRSSTLATILPISDSLDVTVPSVTKSERMRMPPALRGKESKRENVLHTMAAAGTLVKRRMADEQADNNDEYNAEDQRFNQTSIGFDMANYAIKYTQCATVHTYSNDTARDENADTALTATQRFAIVRLCPKDQCSSSSTSTGCDSNYGEYIISLDQFLVAMLQYQMHRVAGYCEYCINCASKEAAKSFWTHLHALRTNTLEAVEASYQTWYTNYLESYASGNGNNDAYANADANTAAQLYYEQTRHSYTHASHCDSGSSTGSSSSDSQYQWQNRANWEFPNKQIGVDHQHQHSYWTSLASERCTSTWYGRPIFNGYYKNGAFIQHYGYFNSEGHFYSLQHDTIEWDDTLYGTMPDGWDGIDARTESCSSQHAGSCYHQFDTCLQIISDQTQQRATLRDFLGCVEVDPMAQYANEQNPIVPPPKNFNCYDDDEACAKAQEYANQQGKNANRRYYIGPHCASNSRDIGLAVYQDKYCSVVDSQWTVEQVLGFTPYLAAVSLSSNECVTCAPDEVSPFRNLKNVSRAIPSFTGTNAVPSFCTGRRSNDDRSRLLHALPICRKVPPAFDRDGIQRHRKRFQQRMEAKEPNSK
jgi:hypothetical protein